LKKDQLLLDTKPLLKLVLSEFFGDSSGFVEMCLKHIPNPKEGAEKKACILLFQNIPSNNRI
jgi:U5 small nuclear ribonucleoprotein component